MMNKKKIKETQKKLHVDVYMENKISDKFKELVKTVISNV